MIGALAALLAAPMAAWAQRVSSAYKFVERKQDLGVLVGYIWGDAGKADLGPTGGPTVGLQYAYRISTPIQLGAYAAYVNSNRDVIDPRAEGGATSIGTTPQDLLLIAGRLHFNLTGARTWHNLIPYFFGGAGMAIDLTGEPICLFEPNDVRCGVRPEDRYNFKSSFLGQFGVGFAWLPGARWGARITFNDNIWKIRTPDGFFDPDVQLDPFPPDTDWTNNWQLAAALTFWF